VLISEQRSLERIALLEQRARVTGRALGQRPSLRPGVFASAEEFLRRADATASGRLILDRRLESMHSYKSPFRHGHYSMRLRTRFPMPLLR
jgi:hypothetical protein